MSDHVLRGENIEHGPLGDLQLAQGEAVGLRIWRDYTTSEKAARTRPYEIVGHASMGEMTVIIDRHPEELVEGGSFVIPPNTSHSYRIPIKATVIEATAPPARVAGTDLIDMERVTARGKQSQPLSRQPDVMG
ncbi:MAG: cupin domain-containing protein [Gammaproteobacteria bacterium]|jgi:hypothetical protein|nr:cupin domain-containing protein [Gammaproteobacteria bacterium]